MQVTQLLPLACRRRHPAALAFSGRSRMSGRNFHLLKHAWVSCARVSHPASYIDYWSPVWRSLKHPKKANRISAGEDNINGKSPVFRPRASFQRELADSPVRPESIPPRQFL